MSGHAERRVGTGPFLRRIAQVAGLLLVLAAVLGAGASATVNPEHRSEYVRGVSGYQVEFKKYDATLAGAEKSIYGMAKGCKQMLGNPSEKEALEALERDASELSSSITGSLPPSEIVNDEEAITAFADKARPWFSDPPTSSN